MSSLKSWPPSRLLPASDWVMNMPPCSCSTDTSIVPPPKNLHLDHLRQSTALTQVDDDHEADIRLVVEAIGESGGCRLANHSPNVETHAFGCLLRCVSLCSVKFGRHRDDEMRKVDLKELLGTLLQVCEYDGADVFRSVASITLSCLIG